MFSLLSRNAPRVGNTYICSSCILTSLLALDAPKSTSSARPYMSLQARAKAKASRLKKRAAIQSGREEIEGASVAEDVKGRDTTASPASRNPVQPPKPKSNPAAKIPAKKTPTPAQEVISTAVNPVPQTSAKSAASSPRPKAQQRMIDRRKARLASLKAARPDASFKSLLRLYRAELERESSIGLEASQNEVGKAQDSVATPKKKVTKKTLKYDEKLGDLEKGAVDSLTRKKKVAKKPLSGDVKQRALDSGEGGVPVKKSVKKPLNDDIKLGDLDDGESAVPVKKSAKGKVTKKIIASPVPDSAVTKVTGETDPRDLSVVPSRRPKSPSTKIRAANSTVKSDVAVKAEPPVTRNEARTMIQESGGTQAPKEKLPSTFKISRTLSVVRNDKEMLRDQKREAVRTAMKEFKRAEAKEPRKRKTLSKTPANITRYVNNDNKNPSHNWKRSWVSDVASAANGGSTKRREMLLKLITDGNMTRSDLDASVPLIRGLLQKMKEREDSIRPTSVKMSLGEAMRGTPMSRKVFSGEKFNVGDNVSEHVPVLVGKLGVSVRGATPREIATVGATELKLNPIDTGALNVPKLSYGLERVLFNPGVYQLQDPRTKVFNFDPYLQEIMPVSEFDFNALKAYVTSSKDGRLMGMAREQKKKYTGSTSSMTSTLGHFHFLLSQWRPINAGTLSRDFPAEFQTFTQLQRGPTAIFLRHTDGVYAIDADKEFDGANILSSLGKSMEKLLTLPMDGFERYRKVNSSQITEEERNEEEAFHFTTMGDFLMRSQLDAHDARLPGTGMFDLKTRAVAAIRMDTSAYELGSGYEIQSRFGDYESYEREYYDLIRSAFLKYSLQVRMGRMDGIFVAYHNIERIFGFQYISLEEMDYALHGTYDLTIGDSEFKLSVDLLNRVLDRATTKYPGKSLRMFFETRPGKPSHFMYIFVQPVEEKDIEEIQTANKGEIDKFEARVLGLTSAEEELKQAESTELSSNAEREAELDEEEVERTPGSEEDEIDHEQSAAAQEDDGDDDEGDSMEEVKEDEEADNDETGEEDEDVEDVEEDSEEADGEEDSKQIEAKEEQLDNAVKELIESGASSAENPEDAYIEERAFPPDETGARKRDAFTSDEVPSKVAAIQHDTNSTTGSVAQDADPAFTISKYQSGKRPEDSSEPDDTKEVFAMVLKLRNKVNGEFVARPENLTSRDSWEVEYQIAEIDTVEAAREMYKASKKRRQAVLKREPKAWNFSYRDKLLGMAKRRRAWRKNEEEMSAKEGGKSKIRLDDGESQNSN